jgi:heme exporter protein D
MQQSTLPLELARAMFITRKTLVEEPLTVHKGDAKALMGMAAVVAGTTSLLEVPGVIDYSWNDFFAVGKITYTVQLVIIHSTVPYLMEEVTDERRRNAYVRKLTKKVNQGRL